MMTTLLLLVILLSSVGAAMTLFVWRKSGQRSHFFSALGAVLMAATALSALLEWSNWVITVMISSSAAATWYGVYLARKELRSDRGNQPTML